MNISYNSLNLPEEVTMGNKTIEYIYDGESNLLAKEVEVNGQPLYDQSYIGNLVYEDGALKQIMTPFGRVNVSSGQYHYEYFIKDHLGNIRVMFADYNGDNQAEIIQEDHFYPFGMRIPGLSYLGSGVQENDYLYNGKQLHKDEYGGKRLNWYSYGFRYYDPQLARWHVVDPLSEKYYSHSPYNYVGNNPINYVDPYGLYMAVPPGQWHGKLNLKSLGVSPISFGGSPSSGIGRNNASFFRVYITNTTVTRDNVDTENEFIGNILKAISSISSDFSYISYYQGGRLSYNNYSTTSQSVGGSTTGFGTEGTNTSVGHTTASLSGASNSGGGGARVSGNPAPIGNIGTISGGGSEGDEYPTEPYNGPMVRGGYAPVAGTYGVPVRFVQALYGLAAEGMMISEIINQLGNDHYPGPWSTTQPDPTNQLNTYYDSDNPYNPFGNGGNYNRWVKWFLYGVGAKEVYDNINDQQPIIILPDDNYEEIIVPYRPDYNP